MQSKLEKTNSIMLKVFFVLLFLIVIGILAILFLPTNLNKETIEKEFYNVFDNSNLINTYYNEETQQVTLICTVDNSVRNDVENRIKVFAKEMQKYKIPDELQSIVLIVGNTVDDNIFLTTTIDVNKINDIEKCITISYQ